MPTYKYTALDAGGQQLKGAVDAKNEFEAAAMVKTTTGARVQKVTAAGLNLNIQLTDPKISEKALSLCCSQFAILLKAGLPLARTVAVVAEQCPDKVLKEIFLGVKEDVAGGLGLADSLQSRGPKLPIAFIETVRAGEASGTLETSFKKMETYFAKGYKLKAKVKSAMTYPIILMIVAVVVVAIVVQVALPAFLPMFEGRDLPGPTAVLMVVYNFMKKWWFIPVGVILLLAVAARAYARSPQGKRNLSAFAMRMPILGKVNTMNAASQFANTMATLLTSGLPMVRALEITAKVVTNMMTGRSIEGAVRAVIGGSRVGDALRANPYLPSLLLEMTAVGEESGSLEETLTTIGAFYDEEADAAVTAALSKLEPLITVVMGAVVGFILISLYLPMFTMYDGML